jgi:SAM-dependent methyltransferase
MPVMSKVEAAFCRSAPWRGFTARVVTPWVLSGQDLTGDVLEVGAGAGANTAVFARTQPAATITATDIDPAMVTAARRRVAHLGARVTVEEADTTALPFDDDSFDTAISLLMLHHVIDWENALGELARVLRPGGRLLGYDLTATRVARTIHLADRSPHQLLHPGQLRNGLAAAGFADIDVAAGLAGLVARFHATTPAPPRENQP